MATTTNYGWTTPDDTALVKDGAAAIRTLGSSVDTTTKALNPSTTLGDIEYRSSTANTNTRLGIGSTGQVLSVTGGVPAWATLPAAGGETLISTATLSSATSISFTSIPTTYKHLRFVFIACRSTSSYWNATFNNDTAGNYQSQASAAAVTGGNSTNSSAGVGATDGRLGIIPATYNGQNNGSCNGYMRIDNYTSTTLQRTGVWQNAGYDGSYFCVTGAFNYNSTGTAITRVDFVRGSSQTISGEIQLWGIA
jgi:hypothetical protein